MYRFYLCVLKLVLAIVPTITVILALMSHFFQNKNQQLGSLQFVSIELLFIITTWIRVVISCAFSVTAVFFLLKICRIEVGEDRIELFEGFINRKKTSNFISVSETIFELIGIAFLTWLLYFKPEYIATYQISNSGLTPIVPLFNNSLLTLYHPMILAVYGFGFILAIGKLMVGKWSIGLSIAHLIYKVGVCLLFCLLIANQSVFNPNFFEQLFIHSSLDFMVYWGLFSKVMMIIMVVVTFFDVMTPFSKLIKEI